MCSSVVPLWLALPLHLYIAPRLSISTQLLRSEGKPQVSRCRCCWSPIQSPYVILMHSSPQMALVLRAIGSYIKYSQKNCPYLTGDTLSVEAWVDISFHPSPAKGGPQLIIGWYQGHQPSPLAWWGQGDMLQSTLQSFSMKSPLPIFFYLFSFPPSFTALSCYIACLRISTSISASGDC